ncbi:conserved Plasmodium protein, unknown function [Plasmodium malariae]|uniref:Uncharacterized protein n=1 Tax=Plasmodium malariae TaxID=5858 RepID=A0A1D3JJA9_PLAMA|nr:conserved Plasmodium protein, unknown function [Plasmodium malariae]SBT86600.1 conserved Plasmodium protein, unknown function [Plasmodium malariae]
MKCNLFRLFPTEPTGSLIKIKNITFFEKDIEIKHFLEHIVDVCIIFADSAKNEACALLHSREEALHLMKLYKVIFKNMIFFSSNKQNMEIEIFNQEEERIFWKDVKRHNVKFYVCKQRGQTG